MEELFWHQNNRVLHSLAIFFLGRYVLSQVVLIFLMEVFSYFFPSFVHFCFVYFFFQFQKAICCRWRYSKHNFHYYFSFSKNFIEIFVQLCFFLLLSSTQKWWEEWIQQNPKKCCEFFFSNLFISFLFPTLMGNSVWANTLAVR